MKTKKIVNLCPHPITVRTEQEEFVLASEGMARVDTTPSSDLTKIGGIPVKPADKVNGLTGMPAPKAGTVYVVSAKTADACPTRYDLLVPGTSPTDDPFRDEDGRVVAVRYLKFAR